jgi:hypothetical protein
MKGITNNDAINFVLLITKQQNNKKGTTHKFVSHALSNLEIQISSSSYKTMDNI